MRFVWLLMIPMSTKTDVSEASQVIVRSGAMGQKCHP